jgi:hypothetical protein
MLFLLATLARNDTPCGPVKAFPDLSGARSSLPGARHPTR